MAKTKISKVAKDLNVALPTVIDFLRKKDITVDENPNTRIEDDVVQLLMEAFSKDKDQKRQSDNFTNTRQSSRAKAVKEPAKEEPAPEPVKEVKAEEEPAVKPEEAPAQQEEQIFHMAVPKIGPSINVVGKIDLDSINQSTRPKKKTKEERRNERISREHQGQAGTSADRKKRKRISGKEKIDIEKTPTRIKARKRAQNGVKKSVRPSLHANAKPPRWNRQRAVCSSSQNL